MKRHLPLLALACLTVIIVGWGTRAGLTTQAAPMTDVSPLGGEWRTGGPFDAAGRPVAMNAVAASPHYEHDGILFAAGVVTNETGGRLYRSTNRGHTWQEVLHPELPGP
ncbi:MAG: hypothetical protein QXZ09_07190, partial [Candidatus Methanomethylicaceae archaeon]